MFDAYTSESLNDRIISWNLNYRKNRYESYFWDLRVDDSDDTWFAEVDSNRICTFNFGLDDPSFEYLGAQSETSCRVQCQNNANCTGYSHSHFGNCINWTHAPITVGYLNGKPGSEVTVGHLNCVEKM